MSSVAPTANPTFNCSISDVESFLQSFQLADKADGNHGGTANLGNLLSILLDVSESAEKRFNLLEAKVASLEAQSSTSSKTCESLCQRVSEAESSQQLLRVDVTKLTERFAGREDTLLNVAQHCQTLQAEIQKAMQQQPPRPLERTSSAGRHRLASPVVDPFEFQEDDVDGLLSVPSIAHVLKRKTTTTTTTKRKATEQNHRAEEETISNQQMSAKRRRRTSEKTVLPRSGPWRRFNKDELEVFNRVIVADPDGKPAALADHVFRQGVSSSLWTPKQVKRKLNDLLKKFKTQMLTNSNK